MSFLSPVMEDYLEKIKDPTLQNINKERKRLSALWQEEEAKGVPTWRITLHMAVEVGKEASKRRVELGLHPMWGPK